MGKIVAIILFSLFLSCVFFLGWHSNNLYRSITRQRDVNGLWIGSDVPYSTALEIAHEYDYLGRWVCVNIKGMDFETAYDTCKHEVGHEIFAEFCQDNMKKCLEIAK